MTLRSLRSLFRAAVPTTRLVVGVLFLGVFSSCTSSSADEVYLFNDLYFSLQAGEEEAPINDTVRRIYEAHFAYPNTQVPLFKYVKHRDYAIFLGLPVRASVNRMLDELVQRPDLPAADYTLENGKDFYYATYRKDSVYVAEYLKQTTDQSLVFLGLLSSDQVPGGHIAERVNLSARIHTK